MRPLFPGGMGRPIRPSMRKSGDRPAIVSTRPALEGGAAHAVFRSYGCTDLDSVFFRRSSPAAAIRGSVVDPSGAAVPGAQVSAVNRLGVVAQTTAGASGIFELKIPEDGGLISSSPPPDSPAAPWRLAAAARIELDIAPQVDSVKVVGSAMDVAASAMPASVTVISGTGDAPAQRTAGDGPAALRARRGPQPDRLARRRHRPLHPRAAIPTSTWCRSTACPSTPSAANFDFAHIPAESLDRIEVVRGPQSAIYGPYANSGVINFVTRSPESGPRLDVVAEGGTYQERRFGISGAGMLAGWGVAASASRLAVRRPCAQQRLPRPERAAQRVAPLRAAVARAARQLHLQRNRRARGRGAPIPKHMFTGIDTVSRNKNNFSDYLVHYTADAHAAPARSELYRHVLHWQQRLRQPLRPQLRQEHPRPGRSADDRQLSPPLHRRIRRRGGPRAVEQYLHHRCQFSTSFRCAATNTAVYMENRFDCGRLFLNCGLRGEFITTPAIPGDGFSRPFFPDNHVRQANPKLAAAYTPRRARAFTPPSVWACGLPPASNSPTPTIPRCCPSGRAASTPGSSRACWQNRLSLDATYFYNRFYDLIVTLGGSLTPLSRFQSDNLANSRAQGAEFSARLRPARWVFVTGSYTLLATRILVARRRRATRRPALHRGAGA